jgi:3-isopropylmalate/(R)-2-methylmalate dehydratase small subunit
MSASRIDRVEGSALVLRGDDLDTDRIIPARFLKAITFEGLEAHVFADDRQQSAAAGTVHPFDRPEVRGARVLIVGANFGCGSSREHAPQALWRWGIRAVVGESFAEIFAGNALAIGLPCVTASRADLDTIRPIAETHPDARAVVDLEDQSIAIGDTRISMQIPAESRAALLSGHWDATGLLLEHPQDVAATRARIPYLNRFISGRSAEL